MAKIIGGKKLAKQREERLTRAVSKFKKKTGVSLKLVAVMVGDEVASKLYLRVKERAAKRVGILSEKKKFPADINEKEIVRFIKAANRDSSVHGIMVQLPLPRQLAKSYLPRRPASPRGEQAGQLSAILSSVDPRKDVDCLTLENLGLLMIGRPRFLPATVKAVVEILHLQRNRALDSKSRIQNRTILADSDFRIEQKTIMPTSSEVSKFTQKDYFATSHKIPPQGWNRFTPKGMEFLQGREVVIVGAGRVVGLPLAVHLKNLGATVTVGDEFTKDLAEHTKRAEILISATGVPGLIKKEMVKKGAVVIDVGSPKGDVDFEKVKEVASVITPVPGGVGPLTAIFLLENVLLSAKMSF